MRSRPKARSTRASEYPAARPSDFLSARGCGSGDSCGGFGQHRYDEARMNLNERVALVTGGGTGIVAKRSSPKTHVSLLKCPLFVFWALDDPLPGDALPQFTDELTRLGGNVTKKTVPTGGHFEPMVNPGIPLAIEWLRSLPGERAAAE